MLYNNIVIIVSFSERQVKAYMIKDFLNRMSSDEGTAIRYRIIYAFCFVIHAFYAILFGTVEVTELMAFNIFSTCMYCTGLFSLRNNKYTFFWFLILSGEIFLHGFLCSFFLGYNYHFFLYSLAMIPVTFFMTYLDPAVKHPYIISTVMSAINVVTMILSLIYSRDHEAVYNTFPGEFISAVDMINLVNAIMILVSFSVMFISKINYDLGALKEQNETLDKLANYDQLTGLRNRNHIREIFGQYIKSTEPYCVILGDIDDFKRVNDTYGHSAGDEVLKTISSIILDNVGEKGVVCRWGGEEILILVKGSDAEGIKLAETILGQIRAATVESGKYKINVTMTFGLCDYGDAMNIEKLISLADKRLYIGKKSGKNQVVTKG